MLPHHILLLMYIATLYSGDIGAMLYAEKIEAARCVKQTCILLFDVYCHIICWRYWGCLVCVTTICICCCRCTLSHDFTTLRTSSIVMLLDIFAPVRWDLIIKRIDCYGQGVGSKLLQPELLLCKNSMGQASS